MKYFETFAGVGGFSNGIHSAIPDAECVGMSEIDRYASAVFKYNYPNVRQYGDISKINWNTVPDFDLLTGGSPCQDFSIAGKRSGLSGKRSGLFREFLRALNEKQPQHFIWENVKGVMSSRNGWDFANIQAAFSEAGYSLWWQVLNAKDFGVPQNRERIFVVGTREGSPREILFETGNSGQDIEQVNQPTHSSNRVYSDNGSSPSLRSQVGGHAKGSAIVQVNQPTHSNDRIYSDEGIAPTLNTMQGGRRQPFVEKDTRIRRLTPTECERLMGWPDGWTSLGLFETSEGSRRFGTKEISDTQRYKMCGNGVVSNCVEAIVRAHLA